MIRLGYILIVFILLTGCNSGGGDSSLAIESENIDNEVVELPPQVPNVE